MLFVMVFYHRNPNEDSEVLTKRGELLPSMRAETGESEQLTRLLIWTYVPYMQRHLEQKNKQM